MYFSKNNRQDWLNGKKCKTGTLVWMLFSFRYKHLKRPNFLLSKQSYLVTSEVYVDVSTSAADLHRAGHKKRFRKWIFRNILPGNLCKAVWTQEKIWTYVSHRFTWIKQTLSMFLENKIYHEIYKNVPRTDDEAGGFSCWPSSACPPSQKPVGKGKIKLKK